MALVLDAWTELESERYLGPMCAGPIPRSAIRDWCADGGIDRELMKMLFDAIRYLDAQRSERIASELAHQQNGA